MRLPIRRRDDAASSLAARGRRIPPGILGLAVLCLFIVAIGMIRPRLAPADAGWVLLGAGLLILAGALAFLGATHRVAQRLPLVADSWRLVDAVRVMIRRLGLPFLALGFFLFWTFVYMGLWWFRPDGSFSGLDEAPRFADFFYYAVSTAFVSPPGDIIPTSRGARSATMIEMLTGFALLTAWLSSILEWRRDPTQVGSRGDGPPGTGG